MKKCGKMYGTGQWEPDVKIARCERVKGHPPVSGDGIGHWGRGDNRLDSNPDLPANAPRRINRKQEEIIRDHLREVFKREAVQRPDRPDSWDRDELNAMHAEVNKLRILLGREPVGIELIRDASSMASGHCDYYLKFPLYCMDVVFDRQPRP